MSGREHVPASMMRMNMLYEEVVLPVRPAVPAYADPALLLANAAPAPAHQPAMLRSYETVIAEPNLYRLAHEMR